ncbi:MAG: formylglycine-generating enzyme family protein [Symploca sp. SIO2B6]|nr:formylglycine-generating enzyme family protein [Symploca sp. SIO2B6]
MPVECISWYDAQEFCNRLSQQTGREYRLPTEAEWEYACRAGTTSPYHFGEAISPELANFNQNRNRTTPVGSFRVANNFGLYDMHGNVLELCADNWHDNYEGAPSDGRACLRGGSWTSILLTAVVRFASTALSGATSATVISVSVSSVLVPGILSPFPYNPFALCPLFPPQVDRDFWKN